MKKTGGEVDADDLLEELFGGAANLGCAGNACVGEDDVELAELFAYLFEDGLAGLGVGDVALEADGVGAELGDGGVEGLLISASNGDVSAFFNEEECGGETDSAVASGDKSFLSCEFHESTFLV